MQTKRVPTSVSLDPELMRRVKQHLRDPVRQRTQYGALSRLIEALLWGWVREQDNKGANQ